MELPSIHTANTTPAANSPTAESDDKNQGKGGTTTKRTRHGLVTIKPSTTSGTTTDSVKSTTTATTTDTPSKRKSSQQGLADGDVTKDGKRSTPSSSPSPVIASSKRKSTQQGSADGDVTKDVKRSVPSVAAPSSATSNGSAVTVKVTTITTLEPPHDLTHEKSSKSQSPGLAASSKEKMKQDVVGVETEKGRKQVDSSTPQSSSSSKLRKDKGKEKDKDKTKTTTPAQMTLTTPKPTPHTFSAFAPLADSAAAATTTAPLPDPPVNLNGNVNEYSNNRSSLPPAEFSFPPPPPHSPQRSQSPSQQPKNSLNGSAAANYYALRQKANSSPKPSGNIGGIWMNMAAVLEEDEADVDDGSTPTRRLRRMPNGGNGKGKGKEKRRISDSTSSRSDDSSHYSYSVTPSRSNANSHPTTSNYSNTQSQQSQSHSESRTFRSPPKTLTSEVNAMTLSTPGELPSKGTQGYSPLVLPRAPLPNSLYFYLRIWVSKMVWGCRQRR